MKTYKSLTFGGIAVSAPKAWRDISEETETGESVFTLAQDEGEGALQFSIAFYQRGPIPNPSVSDLMDMVTSFGTKRNLQESFDAVSEDGECRFAAASYRLKDAFFRLWYVSDGRNFAFVTYNSDWGMQSRELPDCEDIVRSIRFAE
jgi:hypothetical protein